jgi:uncharacterized protein (TIGR02217 family)
MAIRHSSIAMFHDTRFPTAISRAAHGGPERRTDVVVLGSGAEERNARWADSRRSWNAGYGVKSLDDLHAVIAFFEERRGRLHGFRWRDPLDFKSCPPEATPTPLDQPIATGDGATATFQLVKTYGSAFNPWPRAIRKPVAGTVLIAVAGITQAPGTACTVDHTTGIVTFTPGHIPAVSQPITAGFEFDVPVRFDTDRLEISLQGFRHGAIPSIPIVEIRL